MLAHKNIVAILARLKMVRSTFGLAAWAAFIFVVEDLANPDRLRQTGPRLFSPSAQRAYGATPRRGTADPARKQPPRIGAASRRDLGDGLGVDLFGRCALGGRCVFPPRGWESQRVRRAASLAFFGREESRPLSEIGSPKLRRKAARRAERSSGLGLLALALLVAIRSTINKQTTESASKSVGVAPSSQRRATVLGLAALQLEWFGPAEAAQIREGYAVVPLGLCGGGYCVTYSIDGQLFRAFTWAAESSFRISWS